MSFIIPLGIAVLLGAPAGSAAAPTPDAPTPNPSITVLLNGGLLVACHRSDVGWFDGPRCEAAASGAEVQDMSGARRTLAKIARDAACGGTEGYRAFAEPGPGLWSSVGTPFMKCPAIKAPKLTAAEREIIAKLIAEDVAARPTAWKTWEDRRDGAPLQAGTFEIKEGTRLGDSRFLHVRGFGRALSAVVRLDGNGSVAIIAREPHGPTWVLPDRCLDVDRDGQAEIMVAHGGETERLYRWVRFIDGWPSTIASMGCGD